MCSSSKSNYWLKKIKKINLFLWLHTRNANHPSDNLPLTNIFTPYLQADQRPSCSWSTMLPLLLQQDTGESCIKLDQSCLRKFINSLVEMSQLSIKHFIHSCFPRNICRILYNERFAIMYTSSIHEISDKEVD